MNQTTSSATVWLHVSTLMKWDRPPVGIVRVEREYCRWLLAHGRGAGGQVRFCVYDDAHGQFVEIDAAQVAARLQPSSAPPAPAAPAAPLAGWKRLIKRLWRGVEPLLPQRWASAMRSSARLAFHHLLQARGRWRGWASRHGLTRRDAVAVPAAAPFAPGDHWVSVGADWEYLDLPTLYRIKQQLNLKVTLICYDTIPVQLPQFFAGVLTPGEFAAYLVDLAWCADEVLCISECTRRDFESLMRSLDAPLPPTAVIRLGSDIHTATAAQAPGALAHGPGARPFVLFVSTIERRKNHETLYRAWVRLRERGMVPHRLVFVGMRGWGVDGLFSDLRLDQRVAGDIVVLDHVSDAELAWLYRHCEFTVFPSLYEGWGLPVVESLAWGKFCLASNAASVPEAGGPWAEYLDPWDLPAWVDRLAHYMRHPEAVAAHNQRIAREFRAPGWAESAAAMHELVMHTHHRASPAGPGQQKEGDT